MMGLTMGIRYLCGRVTATHPADREQAEWPVHPDRVFMALAAAHFETGADPGERAALEWLEQRAPRVVCPSAERLDVMTCYVPVNDTSAPRLRAGQEPSAAQIKSGLAILPENRARQPRQFPTAFLHDDAVYLMWDDPLPSQLRVPLDSLCRKATYIGHSSTLVQVWLEDAQLPEMEPVSNASVSREDGATERWVLIPQQGGLGRFRLRVPGVGRLARLESAFQRGQRPPTSIAMGYDMARPQAESVALTGSHFSSDLIVLRQVAGPRFGLESTQRLVHHLRRTLLSLCPEPIPEWFSGHRPDNRPSQRRSGHLALVPLAHVGRRHADGHLLGLALVFPRDVPADESARCLRDLLFDGQGWAREIPLKLGTAGECVLQLDDGIEYRKALQSSTWTTPSRRWATVTPVCLDRHPRGKDYWRQVECQIAHGCERIGLPRPASVIASPTPLLAGVPHGRNMPRLTRKSDGGTIQHTHAAVMFDRPVRGPLLVGAGRYRGYGLFRPLDEPGGRDDHGG